MSAGRPTESAPVACAGDGVPDEIAAPRQPVPDAWQARVATAELDADVLVALLREQVDLMYGADDGAWARAVAFVEHLRRAAVGADSDTAALIMMVISLGTWSDEHHAADSALAVDAAETIARYIEPRLAARLGVRSADARPARLEKLVEIARRRAGGVPRPHGPRPDADVSEWLAELHDLAVQLRVIPRPLTEDGAERSRATFKRAVTRWRAEHEYRDRDC